MDNRDLRLSCDSGRRRCSDNDIHSDIFREDSVFIIKRERIGEMESMIDEKGRYSAESIRISRSRFALNGLDRLANRSRALVNDTLYFLRQYYFFHNTNDPEKRALYRRNIGDRFYKTIKESKYSNEEKDAAIKILNDLFVNFRALKSTFPTIMKFMKSYKDIGYSICAQQIVLAVCNTFISHLKLIRKYYNDLKKWNHTAENQRGQKPSRPGLPRYLGKKVAGERVGKWKLIYTKQRLEHKRNIKSLEDAINNKRYTCYMYVPPSHEHIIPPIRVRVKVLQQLLNNGGFVEIIPKGSSYSFNIHYVKSKTQRAREYGLNLEKYEQNPNRAISIDLGVNNFLTVFNNFGAKFPIFKGSAIKRWNYRINHKIPPLQRGSDVISDILKRYNSEKDKTLESIIDSRIHTYHDEFENLRRMILYVFRRIFELSKMNKMGLPERNFYLKCFRSKSFFRVAKNLNWDNFKKLAEKDGKKVYSGIFNKVRKVILMEIAPREKNSLLHKYFRYLKSKRDYKLQILETISGWSVQDLQEYLESLGLRIDELWDKYNRIKRDAINKIAKKLIYYCLYYKVGTITFGYNKGWQSNAVKLKKLTRDLFVSLPFNQMFERIQVEALYFGITVDYTPEWYTSKCSYIDNESIGKKPNGEYAGSRRFTQNGVKHNGLFRPRHGKIIHGDINGAANIGRKQNPELFSKKMIAHNLRLISDPRQSLTNQVKEKVTRFITTPPIKFSPSNGIPTKELKLNHRVGISNIKPQRYQMSPRDFLAMTQTAYV